jgi:aryl-alcohol dehydrogenase-like predicted oxidoreductase
MGELPITEDVAGPGHMACDQVLYHLGERAIERTPSPSRAAPAAACSPRFAHAHNATPRQVALAFLVCRPAVFAIPKAASIAHVEENAGAGDLALSADDIGRIEAAFPLGRPRRSLPML